MQNSLIRSLTKTTKSLQINAMREELSAKITTQFSEKLWTPKNIAKLHKRLQALVKSFDAPAPEMRIVENIDITFPKNPPKSYNSTLKGRLYMPFSADTQPSSCLLYFHGGGFVTGSVQTHEGLCMRIAQACGFRVLSLEYRLAPDHPFPAAPDDCEQALTWLLSGQGENYGVDADKVFIGGDSAGGNLAAYLTQKYRTQIKAQILLYPLLQFAEIKPIKRGLQDVLALGVAALTFIKKHYVGEADITQARLSPLFELDLKGLPPSFIFTCGLDPLRVEGKVYAQNLQSAGVKVTHYHAKNLPHGCLNFAQAFPKTKKTPLAIAKLCNKHT